ncbi:MAG: hypothetical protein QM527_01230 [Alphaproteobacteria bacterium]|nr:hypothetical protein [Alphaproteobacteria bacterium]MDI9329940.1 hypothetical protein [Alphaproteobacteria bacterium]
MDQYLEPERFKIWKRWTQGLYILYVLSIPTLGLTALVALFIDYIKIHGVTGTIFESHMQWQIRTFWVALFGLSMGVITIFFSIGVLFMGLTLLWCVYRIAWGLYRLSKNKAMYD